jgi:uncharacterized protein YcfJ
MEEIMSIQKVAARILVAFMVSIPFAAGAQTVHQEAKYAQERHDAHHHTKAKIVAGSAVGGAVIGGLHGGPAGAVIGAGVGAGGGLVANHIRKEHDIHKREETGRY